MRTDRLELTVLLKKSETVSEILRLVIGVVIGIKSDVELLKVNILIKDDKFSYGVGNRFWHPPPLRLDDEIFEWFLACKSNLAFLGFTEIGVPKD